MRFCTNCGSEISAVNKFCPNCGQPTAAPTPAPIPDPTPVSAPTPAQPQVHDDPMDAPPLSGSNSIPTQQDAAEQQSYTPPQQDAAEQQSYTPPQQDVAGQQSNTPLQQDEAEQQSYTPPQQEYAAHTAAPQARKPLNKKLPFIIGGAVLVIILAVVLFTILGGRDNDPGTSSDANAGLYYAVNAEAAGVKTAVSELWVGGFSIELQDNGECILNFDDQSVNGYWTLDGDSFHITCDDFESDGTLTEGILTIENIMDLGVTLTFTKDGSDVVQGGDTEGNISEVSLSYQWNGTWYGYLGLGECTGDFVDQSYYSYDVYMVVNVDADGAGYYSVYLSGVDEALATAKCTADADGLYTESGLIAGEQELHSDNWVFLPIPDYPDQYAMHDEVEDEGGTMEFDLFMKKWGHSWQKEIDIDYFIMPPSVEWYEETIQDMWLPPVGFIPDDYYSIAEGPGLDGDPAAAQGQVAPFLPNAFNGYLPAYNNNPMTLSGDWSGWMQESECRGDHQENYRPVRATIGYNMDNNLKYIDVFLEGDDQNPVFSMWLENEPTDTQVIPVIGDSDAWILDQYLHAGEAYMFTTSVNPNRNLYFSYYYAAESDSGCLVEINLYKD